MATKDEELIQQCLAGVPAGQRALYDRFRTEMFRICLRYAHDRSDAEDILQEGFITVFRDLRHFRGEGPLGGWVRMVMIRTALQWLRRQKHVFVSIEENALNGVSLTQSSYGMKDSLDAQRLTQLIQSLPPGYRVVFNLFAIDGYSHEEIADWLGITVSTSKTQLFKARAWLQQRLPEFMAEKIIQ